MAKVTAPILSIRARGQIGGSQVYASWRGVPYARQYVTPRNPNTSAQQSTRNVFSSIQSLWKRMGSIARGPWSSFSTGKPLTDRNAITQSNVAAMRGQPDRADFVGSPGSNGGVAGTSASPAGGAASGEIDAELTVPAAPTGWTLQAVQAFAMQDGDPATEVPNPIGEAENNAPAAGGSNTATISGLTPNTLHVVAAWPVWQKPDGTTAYGAGITATATSTT